MFLVTRDKPKSTENRDSCPTFLSQTFSFTRIFLKLREVCLPNISVLSVKTYSTTNRDTPVLSTQIFPNQRASQAQKCSSTKSFGTVRQKIFGKLSRYSSLHSHMHRNFHYRKLSETQKSSSTKCCGTVRRNNFDGKSWYTTFYPWSFSIPKCLSSTEVFFYEMFRYCETTKYW